MLRRVPEEEPEPVAGAKPAPPAPAPAAERLLALQRGAGNAAVARMLSSAGRRTLARETDVKFGENDLARVMHIMPWKHGWDELVDDLALDMFPGNKPREENPAKLSGAETQALKEDYAKVVAWLTRALKSPRRETIVGADIPAGRIYQFKYTVPKERTVRGEQAFTIFITGIRPFTPGTRDLADRYIVGDAWVETDRNEFVNRRLDPSQTYQQWKAEKEGAAQ